VVLVDRVKFARTHRRGSQGDPSSPGSDELSGPPTAYESFASPGLLRLRAVGVVRSAVGPGDAAQRAPESPKTRAPALPARREPDAVNDEASESP
jgi:hypothetical protein